MLDVQTARLNFKIKFTNIVTLHWITVLENNASYCIAPLQPKYFKLKCCSTKTMLWLKTASWESLADDSVQSPTPVSLVTLYPLKEKKYYLTLVCTSSCACNHWKIGQKLLISSRNALTFDKQPTLKTKSPSFKDLGTREMLLLTKDL